MSEFYKTKEEAVAAAVAQWRKDHGEGWVVKEDHPIWDDRLQEVRSSLKNTLVCVDWPATIHAHWEDQQGIYVAGYGTCWSWCPIDEWDGSFDIEDDGVVLVMDSGSDSDSE